MVVFKDDPQKYNTPTMFQKIQQDITRVMELHKQIAVKEEAIMLNPVVSFCFLYTKIILFISINSCVCVFAQYVKKCIGNQDEDVNILQSKTYTG